MHFKQFHKIFMHLNQLYLIEIQYLLNFRMDVYQSFIFSLI